MPAASHSIINSVILNFPPQFLIPIDKGFSYTQVCIHVFALSYFILMLRATLCAEVGLLNHNQLNLVDVCVRVGIGGGR